MSQCCIEMYLSDHNSLTFLMLPAFEPRPSHSFLNDRKWIQTKILKKKSFNFAHCSYFEGFYFVHCSYFLYTGTREVHALFWIDLDLPA
jgi:hypothetical protein